jgi:putative NADH-flavin reductase
LLQNKCRYNESFNNWGNWIRWKQFIIKIRVTRKDLDLRAITRSAEKLEKKIGDLSIEIIEADVMDYAGLTKALKGCDVAYYLIHSMEGSSPKDGKNFLKETGKRLKIFQRQLQNAEWIELFI